jgi:hypothetical protein
MKNGMRIGLLSGLILWLATAPGLLTPVAEASKLTRWGRKTGDKIDAGASKLAENLKDEISRPLADEVGKLLTNMRDEVFVEPARSINTRYIQPARIRFREATRGLRGWAHIRNGRFELGPRAQQRAEQAIQQQIQQHEAALRAQLAQLQTQWGNATRAQQAAFIQAQLNQLQQLRNALRPVPTIK